MVVGRPGVPARLPRVRFPHTPPAGWPLPKGPACNSVFHSGPKHGVGAGLPNLIPEGSSPSWSSNIQLLRAGPFQRPLPQGPHQCPQLLPQELGVFALYLRQTRNKRVRRIRAFPVTQVYNRRFRARTFSERAHEDKPVFTPQGGVRAGSARHAILRRQCQIDCEHHRTRF